MLRYQLKYQTRNHEEEVLDFYARSLNGALEFAKAKAQGKWALLCEEDRPICRLELVQDSGVWLVEPQHQHEDQ